MEPSETERPLVPVTVFNPPAAAVEIGANPETARRLRQSWSRFTNQATALGSDLSGTES